MKKAAERVKKVSSKKTVVKPKKVKEPNLVGTLSGHKEGSRAFARYRDIDEGMKKDLVSQLD